MTRTLDWAKLIESLPERPLMRRSIYPGVICDICGVESSSDGLRLCRDCEDLERMLNGDLGLVATVRELIGSFQALQKIQRRATAGVRQP